MNESAAQLAERLLQAQATCVPVPPIRDLAGTTTAEFAYAVQQIVVERGLAEGRRLVGRKIGLTSAAVQAQLGVDQPDYGALFADMSVENGGMVAFGRLLQPKVEAEIAFVLGRDLDGDDIEIDAVAAAIDYAVAALEIVDSRIAGWDIRLFDTIADNASSGMFVLGDERRAVVDLDLELGGMVMQRNGAPVSLGLGAACLGNPLAAALWLARRMAKLGTPLRAGDILLSGALGPMCAAEPGDVFAARIQSLGTVSVRFAEDKR